MNILVIGGEGYIGRELIKYLYIKFDNDFFIKSLDLNLYHQDKYLKKLSLKNFELFNGDMGDKKILKKCLKNIDSVILLAGLVGDLITKKYPTESIEINENNVKNVIDACIEENIERFIFVSTCSNYGLIPNSELASENHILNPLSIYSKSKVEMEKYILTKKSKMFL